MAKGKISIEEITLKEVLTKLSLKSTFWLLGVLLTIIIGVATISYNLGEKHFFDSPDHQDIQTTQSKDTSYKNEIMNVKSPTVTNSIDSSSNVDNSVIVGDGNKVSK